MNDNLTDREFIDAMLSVFPGILTDEEVNGADLVEWISNNIRYLTPDKEKKDGR